MGLDYSDARPLYFNLLNLELCAECLRTLGMGWNIQEQLADAIREHAAVEADAVRELQFKQTQSGSSS